MHTLSDQRGRCQNYKAAFKWLPGNVHSVKVCALRVQAFVQKHYHRDLENVMMSLVDLDVSRLQRGTPEEVLLMICLIGECYHETTFCRFAGFVTAIVNYERNQKSQRSFKSVQINVNVFSSVLILL